MRHKTNNRDELVFEALSKGGRFTLEELATETGEKAASISASIRVLRNKIGFRINCDWRDTTDKDHDCEYWLAKDDEPDLFARSDTGKTWQRVRTDHIFNIRDYAKMHSESA